MSQYEGALLGMGNPLLDIINDVDQAFLDKYQVGSFILVSRYELELQSRFFAKFASFEFGTTVPASTILGV